jgi:N-acetyltransferase
MIVVVDLPEGSFVADPGLGGLGCRTPIPLDGTPAKDCDETNHIVFDGRRRMLKIESGGRTVDAWISGLDEDNWVDFEVANHWFSTHPASPMRQRLMLRAMTPDGRVTVMNRDVTIRANGQAGSRQFKDRTALRRLLQEIFGFDLPRPKHCACRAFQNGREVASSAGRRLDAPHLAPTDFPSWMRRLLTEGWNFYPDQRSCRPGGATRSSRRQCYFPGAHAQPRSTVNPPKACDEPRGWQTDVRYSKALPPAVGGVYRKPVPHVRDCP